MAAAEPRHDRVWAKAHNPDSSLCAALANDPDQRVRRALAGALAAVPASPRTDPVRQHLAADPRFSVRSAMQGQGAFHKPAAVGLTLQRRNVGGLP